MNRTGRALVLIVVLALLGAAAYMLGVTVRGEPELRGTAVENGAQVGDITLVNGGGEEVSLADFAGDYLVVFFGYANCPDICPLTMARLGSMYRSIGEPEGVQVVLITVDPERDSPQDIDSFAKAFHPSFVGLGGSEEALRDAASHFYVSSTPTADGLINHNTQVLLVDKNGTFARIYNTDAQRHLAEDLTRLL